MMPKTIEHKLVKQTREIIFVFFKTVKPKIFKKSNSNGFFEIIDFSQNP